jgi:hypothetical protein
VFRDSFTAFPLAPLSMRLIAERQLALPGVLIVDTSTRASDSAPTPRPGRFPRLEVQMTY